MAAPGIYKSSDAGSPGKLTGVAGSLVALLDAILINGYAGHPAGGGTAWSIAFTAANRRVYRMVTAGGSGFYLDVNDNAPGAAVGGREAWLRGYEVATALSAGTGPFPTVAQIANGISIRKKATADANAATDSPWIAFADPYTFYLFVDSQDFAGYTGFMFGDICADKTGDAYRCMIIGRAINNSINPLASDDRLHNLAAAATVNTGHYMPRTWQAVDVSAVNVGKHGDGNHSTSILIGLDVFPNPYDGNIRLKNVEVHEALGGQGSTRGHLRGFWHFLHPAVSPVNDGDAITGGGALAGRNFQVVRPAATADSLFVIETTQWDTST